MKSPACKRRAFLFLSANEFLILLCGYNYNPCKMLLHTSSRYKEKRNFEKPIDTIPAKSKGRFWRRLARASVIVLATLVIIYLILPSILLSYLNKKWDTMPEYRGHITTIELDIFNLQVRAKGVTISKKNGKIKEPFIYVSQSTLSVDWYAWNKGIKAASIVIDSMEINIVNAPTKELSQTLADTAIFNLADVMMPITRNRLEVLRGTINYKYNHGLKPLDLHLSRLHVLAENLENVDSTDALPAKVNISANAYGAPLELNLHVNVKSQDKRFTMAVSLTRLHLPNVNHLLREFASFDVEEGYFTMRGNIASANGYLKGKVDLDIEELDVFDRKKEKEETGKQKNKERWIEFAGKLLTNKEEKKISTSIDIEGDIKNPKISVWQIIGQALTDAGSKSLSKGFGNKKEKGDLVDSKPTLIKRMFDKNARKEYKELKKKERKKKKDKRKEKQKK